MTLRRRTPLKPSQGTTWPASVREHIALHQKSCMGALAGMPGPCGGSEELDHIRASGGVGMKSKSIATNGARMCSAHHRLKTENGKVWRPRIASVVRALADDCGPCQEEWLREWVLV